MERKKGLDSKQHSWACCGKQCLMWCELSMLEVMNPLFLLPLLQALWPLAAPWTDRSYFPYPKAFQPPGSLLDNFSLAFIRVTSQPWSLCSLVSSPEAFPHYSYCSLVIRPLLSPLVCHFLFSRETCRHPPHFHRLLLSFAIGFPYHSLRSLKRTANVFLPPVVSPVSTIYCLQQQMSAQGTHEWMDLKANLSYFF